MRDTVLDAFRRQQLLEGTALASQSDLFDLVPFGDPPDRYLVHFHCKGLVETAHGVEEATGFEVGIRFPADYLRRYDPARVVTWLGPPVFHPNVSDHSPLVCLGSLPPGTSLVDLVYQLYELITYQKVTMREDDALNRAACQWTRSHIDRLPIDARPLKRRGGAG